MTTNEQRLQRLIELVKSGHVAMYTGPYVDGFLSIFERGGKWFYSSQVWEQTPLEELNLNRVHVYKPVEFE